MSDFQEAVEQAEGLTFRPGVQALKREHRRLVDARDTRLLLGSADIDGDLAGQEVHASASRWDYVLGHGPDNETAHFVEVHPASKPKHVDEVLRKRDWLKEFIADKPLGRRFSESCRRFYWLHTGTSVFAKNTPAARRAAKAGLVPKRKLTL